MVEKKVPICEKTWSGPSASTSRATGPSQSSSNRSADPRRAAPARPDMVGHLLAEHRFDVVDPGAAGGPMAAAARERRMAGSAAGEADQGRGQHDQRKRHGEEEDGDEGGGGEPDLDGMGQRARADPPHRVEDDRQHRRLEAEEQSVDRADIAVEEIEPAQAHDRDDAGQHEQDAGDEPAADAVHQPADIGGELLRLGAGQQHAEVERVQEAALADPAPLLDQHLVHQRDLAGRPAEAQQGDPRPDPHRLAEGDRAAGHAPRSTESRPRPRARS